MNLSHSDINTVNDNQETALGQMGFYNGRIFRYVKAGAVALDRAKLVVAPTVVANHLNMSFAAAPAIGDKQVTVTLGATAATADQYAGGELIVQDGTGEGRSYPVEGNLAADSAGTCTVYLKERIDTAGALSETNVDLIASPYNGVVISATDQADMAIGVPAVVVAASKYAWVASGGRTSVLADEAVAVGLPVTIGTGVAGAVEAKDGAGEQEVGIAHGTAMVDTEYQSVFLTIDKGFAS